MTTLHEAARLVVAAWTSTRRTWVEECNYAVLALDAALKAQAGCDTETDCTSQPWCRISGECHRKQKPPEPAQEPVGIVRVDAGEVHIVPTTRDADVSPLKDGQAVYTAPPKPEPAQEPVAGVVLNEEGRAALVEHGREEWHCVARRARRLYTAPQPQRPPLTDEEIDRLWHDHGAGIDAERFARIARAIERKVRGEA